MVQEGPQGGGSEAMPGSSRQAPEWPGKLAPRHVQPWEPHSWAGPEASGSPPGLAHAGMQSEILRASPNS